MPGNYEMQRMSEYKTAFDIHDREAHLEAAIRGCKNAYDKTMEDLIGSIPSGVITTQPITTPQFVRSLIFKANDIIISKNDSDQLGSVYEDVYKENNSSGQKIWMLVTLVPQGIMAHVKVEDFMLGDPQTIVKRKQESK
jgi:hypothetical protein